MRVTLCVHWHACERVCTNLNVLSGCVRADSDFILSLLAYGRLLILVGISAYRLRQDFKQYRDAYTELIANNCQWFALIREIEQGGMGRSILN